MAMPIQNSLFDTKSIIFNMFPSNSNPLLPHLSEAAGQVLGSARYAWSYKKRFAWKKILSKNKNSNSTIMQMEHI